MINVTLNATYENASLARLTTSATPETTMDDDDDGKKTVTSGLSTRAPQSTSTNKNEPSIHEVAHEESTGEKHDEE